MENELEQMAEEMLCKANEAEDCGLYLNEYDEYNLPEKYKERVNSTMMRWEKGCNDLRRAALDMAQISAEMDQANTTTT